jgi:hypothetical protein
VCLQPTPKVPVVEMLVEPKVPTEKVSVVNAEAESRAAGRETDAAKTVKPLKAVIAPPAVRLVERHAILHAVKEAPKS